MCKAKAKGVLVTLVLRQVYTLKTHSKYTHLEKKNGFTFHLILQAKFSNERGYWIESMNEWIYSA